MRIKTASDLKYAYEQLNPNSPFFSRKTMKFFGDTMRNYGVRKIDKNIYELHRKQPVKHGLQSSHYFNLSTGRESTNLESILED